MKFPFLIDYLTFLRNYKADGTLGAQTIKSSDPSIFTVDNQGNFHALREGEVMLTLGYNLSPSLQKKLGLAADDVPTLSPEVVIINVTANPNHALYRLYNPNSGEHFYTAFTAEKDSLVKSGWKYESQGFTVATSGSTVPVYRLYNPNAGDHFYTSSSYEVSVLTKIGWRFEDELAYYAPASKANPIYRLYNPNAKAGAHFYTLSTYERDSLVAKGWKYEGIAW